jgi:hypothetical protein
MSTPIKPPDSSHLLQQVEQLSGNVAAEKPSAAVPQAVEARSEPAPQAARAGTAVDPVQAIADALRSGEIDAGTAVERLVERALARASGVELSGLDRGQIESFLRQALQDDPTLAAIVRDLERQTG